MKIIKRFKIISFWFVLLFFSIEVYAADYVYRDLMANSLPTIKCKEQKEAEEDASNPYYLEKYSKRFCQTQGYGWHLEKIKNDGQIACSECSGNRSGRFQCHRQDITVACKRLKPGSVGLLPGQGQD